MEAMKRFALLFLVAVLAGAVFGSGLSRVLFNMYFLWWVPFVLVLGGALFWISRDPAKRSPKDRAPLPYEVERDSATRIEHKD